MSKLINASATTLKTVLAMLRGGNGTWDWGARPFHLREHG